MPTDASEDAARHWASAASRWHHVRPPLRPGPEDVAAYRDAVSGWVEEHRRPPRVLLLGVTPELHALGWPEGTELLAADRSAEMIDAVWPGRRDEVVQADWAELALPEGDRDVVLCDAGLAMLPYPHAQQAVADNVRRWLAPGGRLVMRLFAPTEPAETPDRIVLDLREGSAGDLDAVKLRLWMALQRSVAEGVGRCEVWRVLHEAAGGDLEALARARGWPLEHTLGLEVHRGSSARYHFTGLPELRRLFCRGERALELIAVRYPEYVLGRCCPCVVLRRAAR